MSKKKSKRHYCYTLLALIMLVMLSGIGTAYANTNRYDSSGASNLPKLSKEEIAKLLDETEFKTPSSMWDSKPGFNPYSAGRVKNTVLQQATDRLNAMRLLAGLQPVVHNNDLSQQAQHASVLLADGGLIVDNPLKPNGMSDAFYKKALEAVQNSVASTNPKFSEVVDEWLLGPTDSSVGLTARRWQLNPAMAYVGFGYAEKNTSSWWLYKEFTTELCTNKQAGIPAYDFISWPASGNFPNDVFPEDGWWSLQVNPKNYNLSDLSNIQVVLTRVADNKSWIFYDGVQQYGLGFNVGVDSIGSGSMIAFRPDDVAKYVGVYDVKVTGLRTINNVSAELTYRVEFFDADEYLKADDLKPSNTTAPNPDTTLPPRDPNKDPDPVVTPPTSSTHPTPKLIIPPYNPATVEYTDVSKAHWAHSYIQKATKHGIVMGVGADKFEPNRSVIGYEFGAILLRALYGEELAKVKDTNPWTMKIDTVGNTCGIWSGLSAMNRYQPISRYQMATMIVNALQGSRLSKISAKDYPHLTGRFYDWNTVPVGYQDDVATCIYWGILDGVSEGYFGGSSNMDRAQAATVYSRIYDTLSKY